MTGLRQTGKETSILNGKFMTGTLNSSFMTERECSLTTERDSTTAFGMERWNMIDDTEVCLNNAVA